MKFLDRLSVRTKFVLSILVCTSILFAAQYTITSQIISKSYLSLENDAVVQDLQRATDAINNSSKLQVTKLQDWAVWDDSYYFAEKQNQVFIDANLRDISLSNLDISLLVILDPTGKLLFSNAIERATGEHKDPGVLNEALLKEPTLSTHSSLESSADGILMTPEGPLLVASLPLRTSLGEGPSTGTIVFARLLDDFRVSELAKVSHLNISVYEYADAQLPEEIAQAKKELTADKAYYVVPTTDATIKGYTLLNDIHSKPALIVSVESARPIHAQGTLTFNMFTLLGGAAFILFGLLIYLLVETAVLRRFVRFSKQVDTINADRDLSIRVETSGHDDIGRLSAKINDLLSWLSEARTAEKLLNSELKEKTKYLSVELAEGVNSKAAIEKLLVDIEKEKEKVESLVVLRTRELRDEKARLLASINSLPLGFLIADTDDNIIVHNPAISSILGLEAQPVSIRDIVASFRGVAAGIDVLTHSCRECVELKHIVELKDISFGKKYLRIFCTPISVKNDNSKEQVIGYAMLVEDITEAYVTQRSRDEFFAVASHELRTPLTAIRGNISMILDLFADDIKDPDMKEMLSDVKSSSVRLISIVNDFLEVSRLEQGKIEVKLETFDLKVIVEKVMRDLTAVAELKHTRLLYDASAALNSSVIADRSRTEQIILNLVGNAVKFTENGTVNITLVVEGGFLQVRVRDTGLGISEHNQALLFRKFQQAGEQVLARDVTQSTGLGLYISKLIASAMGCTVGLLESTLGKGSTFVFTLPLESAASSESDTLL